MQRKIPFWFEYLFDVDGRVIVLGSYTKHSISAALEMCARYYPGFIRVELLAMRRWCGDKKLDYKGIAGLVEEIDYGGADIEL